MTTQLSTKLAALAVALMVNCMMISSVAYLFSGQIHETAWLQVQSQTEIHAPSVAGTRVLAPMAGISTDAPAA